MRKIVPKWVAVICVVLLVAAAFFAGDYFRIGIASIFGLSSKNYQAESMPDGQSYTAGEVTDVDFIVPIDDSGAGAANIVQQKIPYSVVVDFYPVLLKEAQRENKLLIMTQKATASQTAKKSGLFNLPIFKQTKAIIFHGEGSYFVDLSSLSNEDFTVDDVEKTITITIPKPELSVNLLPEETEFFDSSNGMLRFGEMEITPEAMTTLETQGIERIFEIMDSDTDGWETAIKFAKLSVKEIFEPIVASVEDEAFENADDEYAVPAHYAIVVKVKD